MLIGETKRSVDALGLSGRSVLVAVSGGLDSNALVHALLEIARERCLKLSIGHVNHGLRGDESEGDQQAVLQLADQLGLAAFSRRVEPAQLREGRSSRERPTLQEAARTLRYRALREMVVEAGCQHVATAATGLETHDRLRPALTLLDYRLGNDNGLEVLRGIRIADPEAPVVMMTGGNAAPNWP